MSPVSEDIAPMSGTPPAKGYGYVPLVEVRRGGVVESVHHGAIVAADPGGRVLAAAGDPESVTFLRSAAKPFQAMAVIASGAADRFGITERQIAVIAGSHAGEADHVAEVRGILERIGLDADALLCGAHAPYHRPTALDLRRRGEAPSPLHNNCSGKHAGMLALALHIGAPAGDYLEAGHPAQRRIREAIETCAGVAAGGARLAVDGCSAPTFALPLRLQARMFARLLAPDDLPPALAAAARRVVGAMRAHPFMVAGSDRPCTALIQAGERPLIAKVGAEGVYGLGWSAREAPAGSGPQGAPPHGPQEAPACGLVVKIADGDGTRARIPATLAALEQLEAIPPGAIVALRGRFVEDLRNHRGLRVGEVATVFTLESRGAARAVR
jgi:L-asparaginase II